MLGSALRGGLVAFDPYAWRRANPEKYRESNRLSSQKRRSQRKAVVDALKRVPCVDCGGLFHPEAMDFDHVNEKAFAISRGTTAAFERLLAEIAKCDVVCANCHRVRTWIRRQRRSE